MHLLKMDHFTLLWLSLGLLAIVGNVVAAGKQQSIILYDSTATNATNETFTHNVRNLFTESVTKLGNISKACVQSEGM